MTWSFRHARVNPSPFHVIDCPQFKFMVYTSYLKAFFKANNPIPTQPVREFVFNLTKWRLHTETYEMVHGHRLSLQRSLKPFQGNHHSLRVNTLGGPIPISFAKHNDFQVLKNLCNVPNSEFLSNLVHNGNANDSDTESDSNFFFGEDYIVFNVLQFTCHRFNLLFLTTVYVHD